MSEKIEYHEGDLIRVTNRETGEGWQARARTRADAGQGSISPVGTLYLTNDWTGSPDNWTFLNYWIHSVNDLYHVELVERAPQKPKREVGWYKDADADLWWWNGETWAYDDSKDAITYRDSAALEPIERVYTRDNVLTLFNKAAYEVDPDWAFGGQLLQAHSRLGAAL